MMSIIKRIYEEGADGVCIRTKTNKEFFIRFNTYYLIKMDRRLEKFFKVGVLEKIKKDIEKDVEFFDRYVSENLTLIKYSGEIGMDEISQVDEYIRVNKLTVKKSVADIPEKTIAYNVDFNKKNISGEYYIPTDNIDFIRSLKYEDVGIYGNKSITNRETTEIWVSQKDVEEINKIFDENGIDRLKVIEK